MDSGALVGSAETLIHIFVFLLYVTVCLICYWKLIPRLSLPSKRLATIMLAVQLLVIVLALALRSSTDYEDQIWHLDLEFTIPAAVASTQLVLVSLVALVTAWLARAQPTWHRLYLAGIGLVFLWLALDEFFRMHEDIENWEVFYAALGVVVTTVTAAVAVNSPRRTWIWHICLLAGLAMSATGAIVMEQLRFEEACTSLGFFRLGRCHIYFLEESLEFLGIWLTLIALMGQSADVAPTPRARVRLAMYVVSACVFVLFLLSSPYVQYEFTQFQHEVTRLQSELSRLALRLEYQFLVEPAPVQFESGVRLQSFRLHNGEGASILRLFASAPDEKYEGLGYSIHVVDQVSGNSVASYDKWADRHYSIWFSEPDSIPVYVQLMEVAIPPQTPANRAMWIVLSLWREQDGEYVRQTVLESDRELLSDTQVILGELVLPAASSAPAAVTAAVFDSGFALDALDLPARAQRGETLAVSFGWRTDVNGSVDYTQFLHFVNEDSGTQWGYDQPPMGARLPVRLWYSGLADSEIWEVPLPADLAPGRYAVFTGLYRTSSLERLPVSDADGTPFVDARVPLGILTIE